MKSHVLVVDDDASVRTVLGALLEQAGHAVTRAGTGAEALELVRAQDPDLVLTDLRMPDVDGMELLARLRDEYPEIPVVMLTAHGTVATAVEAMKRGAHDVLTKPFDKAEVLSVLERALGQAERARREFQDPGPAGAPCGMVGASEPLERVRELVEKVAPAPTTVLVTGETGTGKELVARALHELSPRRDGPFVGINCGALPEHLVESELFGHEKGAFTGAERLRPGRFELADGGTLFLDEVGELPPAVQVKLLRVLQDGLVDRLGGREPHPVDVRLVAATHRDLAEEVEEGRFRQDLLYRLSVVEIRVPPLRERPEDVAPLVAHFIEKCSTRLGRQVEGVDDAALALLSGRAWPGNVRELQNAVERAVLLSDGGVLSAADFGDATAPGDDDRESVNSRKEAQGLKAASRAAAAAVERRLIRAALEETGGNVTRSAERLGLSRRGLQVKLKDLGIRAGHE